MRYSPHIAFSLTLLFLWTIPCPGQMTGENWSKKAEESFLLKNWDGLLHYGSKWLESEPNNPIAHCLLGLGLSELHRYDESVNQLGRIADYESGIKISTYATDLQARHPNNAPVQFLLGLSKAREAFEGSIQLRLNAQARDNLFKEAEEALRKSIRIDPNFAAPKAELANMLGTLRSKHDEAIVLYNECISIDPKFGAAYQGMADELRAIGKDAEAKKAYEKCIEVLSSQRDKETAKRQLALLEQKNKVDSNRDNKNWPVFQNKKYGILFRYPKNWDFYDEKNPGPLPGFFVEEGSDKGLAICLNPANRDHNFNIRVVGGTPPSLEQHANQLDQALAQMASGYKKISLEKISLGGAQGIVLVWQSERMGTVMLHKQVVFTYKGNTFTITCLSPQDTFKQINDESFRPFIESIKLGDNVSETEETKHVELGAHFEGADISFDYPKNWIRWEDDSFERVRSFAKSQGIDFIVVLKTKDEARSMQAVKTKNPQSLDSLYQEKKQVADQVTSKGIEIMGQRFVKYSVMIVNLPNNQKAVLGCAERSNGETGISYQLLSGGYEYNINFIYKIASAAAEDEQLRAKVMSTFKFVGPKE
jgi:tetratricopeptide (TPR) repeat protein